MTPESIWDLPGECTTHRTETKQHAGRDFTVTRRSLTFPEEARLLAKCMDPVTKRIDWLEFLAGVVNLTVKDNDFELTSERVRNDLPERTALAWFLIGWLCAETMRNIDPKTVEGLRKKLGP